MAGKISLVDELVTLRADNARLLTDVSALTAARDTAQKQAQDNFAALQTVTGERDSLKADLSIAETSIAGLRAEVTDLGAKNQALTSRNETLEATEKDLTKRTNSEAARVLGASGHRPLAISAETDPAGNPKAGGGSMSRAEFAALSPLKQSNFCRSGGKVTDAAA